jgi:hypothetical protein
MLPTVSPRLQFAILFNAVCFNENHMLWRCLQVGYVMQVTGAQLSPELLELLPDYQLAFSGDQGTMPAGVGDPAGGYSAFYYAQCTQQLNQQYGDILYKVQDLEVGG